MDNSSTPNGCLAMPIPGMTKGKMRRFCASNREVLCCRVPSSMKLRRQDSDPHLSMINGQRLNTANIRGPSPAIHHGQEMHCSTSVNQRHRSVLRYSMTLQDLSDCKRRSRVPRAFCLSHQTVHSSTPKNIQLNSQTQRVVTPLNGPQTCIQRRCRSARQFKNAMNKCPNHFLSKGRRAI